MTKTMLTVMKFLGLCNYEDIDVLTKNYLCKIKVDTKEGVPTSEIKISLFYNTPTSLEPIEEDDIDIFNEMIEAMEGTLKLMEENA